MRPGVTGGAIAVLSVVVLVLELTRTCKVVRSAARRAHWSRARGSVGDAVARQRPGGGAHQSGCSRGHQRLADEHGAPPSVGFWQNRRGGAFEMERPRIRFEARSSTKTPVRAEGQALSRRIPSARRPAITE